MDNNEKNKNVKKSPAQDDSKILFDENDIYNFFADNIGSADLTEASESIDDEKAKAAPAAQEKAAAKTSTEAENTDKKEAYDKAEKDTKLNLNTEEESTDEKEFSDNAEKNTKLNLNTEEERTDKKEFSDNAEKNTKLNLNTEEEISDNSKINFESDEDDDIDAAENFEFNKKHTVKKAVIIAAALILVAFSSVASFAPAMEPPVAKEIDPGTLVSYKFSEVFGKNITIDGINVSGKTAQQAAALISVKGTEVTGDFNVTFLYGNESMVLTQDDFGISGTVAKTVNKAMEYSRTAKEDPEKAANAYRDDPYVKTDAKTGITNFEIATAVNEASINKVIEEVKSKWEIPVRQPTIDTVDFTKSEDEMYTYREGISGIVIDKDKLKKDLTDLFINGAVSGTVTVDSSAMEPSLTIDQIKGNIQLLSEFTTTSTNNANGNENMRLSLAAINGKIIEAGDVFSFNACTGDSNLEENGYKSADVIAGGKIVDGIGGGICQTSTTVYNAAIRANMDIVERHEHYFCSSYSYSGLDAAIDYPRLDLKLQNSTEYPIVFKSWMDGVTLHVQIYGWQDPSYDKILTPSEYTAVSAGGYSATAKRVLYKNGNEVASEALPSSTYVLSAGSSPRPCDDGTQ